MLDDLCLGKFHFEAAIILQNSLLLLTLLSNSESWYNKTIKRLLNWNKLMFFNLLIPTQIGPEMLIGSASFIPPMLGPHQCCRHLRREPCLLLLHYTSVDRPGLQPSASASSE